VNYRPLFLECACGCAPSRIDEVGFSADGELVIHWWCDTCNKLMHTSMPLAQCLKACPPPVGAEDDAHFLASLGIKPT